MLASKLHMEDGSAEKWVVELIRTAALDAKIDSATHQVVMVVPAASVYTQVYEKTRELVMRTRTLADGVEAAVLQDGAREDREARDRERGTAGGRGQGGGYGRP
jgi:translation initiation factor 3 subunit E